MEKRKVLWLCSWYPDKIQPYNGDFIKRHAEAVSAFCDLHIIHVVRDREGAVTHSVKTEEAINGNFSETIIYYHVRGAGITLLEKFLSHQQHEKLYRRAVKNYILHKDVPDFVHVHMGMKAGTTALWIKDKYNIPYIVSEHWSGFLVNASEQFSATPKRFRNRWMAVIRNATAVSAVSETLAKGLQRNFSGLQPIVIPNVVNTNIFFPRGESVAVNTAPQFIHVSGMQQLKNPKLILLAFKKLLESFPAARLNMIGMKDAALISFTKENDMGHAVSFYDEMPQPELAGFVRQSAALILVSSYETFGCVIIEANACGVPVIVSDIPVFHETVTENVNGYFVSPGDRNGLTEAMVKIIGAKENFPPAKLASSVAEKYSYPVVGKMIADWYQQIFSKY